ncbi:unnamed protein product [Phyllotreta striolata]|uniref:Uncharacterized protein n=1 Tax=Phyllotreta striolata TaxID=444603 RepID=A0A9N9XSE1_PHYSR|nr:unnamed protein product [Phyllotreta striolata]
MKSMEIVVITLLLLVSSAYSENSNKRTNNDAKNSTFYYTATRKDTCVKVHYADEHFYKVYCFENLKDHNGSLGFITSKNDTILYTGYGNQSECFDIYESKSKSRISKCLNLTTEVCNDATAGEQRRDASKLNEIPCTVNNTDHYLGFQSKKLNVVFRCVVYSIKVPTTMKNETVPVKYCFNRKVPIAVNKDEKFWNKGLQFLDRMIKLKTLDIINSTTTTLSQKENE